MDVSMTSGAQTLAPWATWANSTVQSGVWARVFMQHKSHSRNVM